MLTSKWTTLNHNYQKFNAIYKRCHHLKKSGENEVDLMGRARVMYQEESRNSPFNHDKAWAILRQQAKWDAPEGEPVELTEDETGDFHTTVNTDELFGADPRPRPPGKQRPGKKPNPTHRGAPGEVNRPNLVSLSLTSFGSNGRPPKRRLRRRKTKTRRLKVWRSCHFSPSARRICRTTTRIELNGKRLKSKPSYAPKCRWNRTTKTTPTSSFF
nr:glutathione S-transferase T3-like [Tanacetum cinerariifolium]